MENSFLKNPLIQALLGLGAIFLAVLIVSFGVTTYQKVSANQKDKETITISATGDVDAKPDVAIASISVMTEGKDPKVVQDENSTKINKITDYLKSSGIKSDDIKTQNYSLYPRYNYPDGKQELDGYSLTQSVVVKIRNLDKVGDIMKGVVQSGANTIDQLTFQIDDPNNLKQEARKKALENAKVKAAELAKVAGLSLGKVRNFSENDYGGIEPMYYADAKSTMGYGGGGAPAPDIQPGSTKVTATVSVTFELK